MASWKVIGGKKRKRSIKGIEDKENGGCLLYCLSGSNLSEDIAFVGWVVADLVRRGGATWVIRQQTQRQSEGEKIKNFKEVRGKT